MCSGCFVGIPAAGAKMFNAGHLWIDEEADGSGKTRAFRRFRQAVYPKRTAYPNLPRQNALGGVHHAGELARTSGQNETRAGMHDKSPIPQFVAS